eukprot:Em0001g2175a
MQAQLTLENFEEKQHHVNYASYETCGYPGCHLPCNVDFTTGVAHRFCGRTHANQYKQLQISGPPVHGSTHQITTSTRHASRSARKFRHITDPIRFYNRDDPYYEFTNFYECAISIDGKKWNTSEHYFQAQKFVGTPYMEVVRNMQRPRDAFDLSRDPSVSPWLRSDWEEVKLNVMYKALLVKFSQHEDLKTILLDTGNRELIEHTSNDSYWGDGGDSRGQNNLGKLLMRVREVLRPTTSVAADGGDAEIGATDVPDLINLPDMMDTGKEGGGNHDHNNQDHGEMKSDHQLPENLHPSLPPIASNDTENQQTIQESPALPISGIKRSENELQMDISIGDESQSMEQSSGYMETKEGEVAKLCGTEAQQTSSQVEDTEMGSA